MQSAVIEVDSDSEYNCSYEAGVYYQWSDSENDETDLDLKWSDSDGDSLIELKVNLHKLKEEFEARKPSKFAQITTTNSALECKKAEWNHTLGYTEKFKVQTTM